MSSTRPRPAPRRRPRAKSWQSGQRPAKSSSDGLKRPNRDFKPDNVLVDAHGRARVVDFGLVHADGPIDEDAPTIPPGRADDETGELRWSVTLTHKSIALGTPAYMSPEQHFGRPVGPYSDQFSFAATLYEALYGERAFGGESWEEIQRQIRGGVIRPPAHPRGPRRLFKILARGLALRPEERWPSVDAMIAALERDPWRSRGRALGLVGLLGAASAASFGIARASGEAPRCEAAGDLTGVWDEARAASVAEAFAAAGAPSSTDALGRVQDRLDAYADAFHDESRSLCEANASGSESPRVLDLRLACLGRRRAHLAALVDVLAVADHEVVEHAVQAVAALPGLAACSDVDALVGGAAPPEDRPLQARVEALRGALARATVLEDTGQSRRASRSPPRSAARRRASATGPSRPRPRWSRAASTSRPPAPPRPRGPSRSRSPWRSSSTSTRSRPRRRRAGSSSSARGSAASRRRSGPRPTPRPGSAGPTTTAASPRSITTTSGSSATSSATSRAPAATTPPRSSASRPGPGRSIRWWRSPTTTSAT
ncbi:MAG: hypothetical protein R3B09_31335 [Nannocystaceae bacterium]